MILVVGSTGSLGMQATKGLATHGKRVAILSGSGRDTAEVPR